MNSRRHYKQQMTSPGRRLLCLFALLAYFFSGAAVPAGFMAAPLEGGSAFHLCPGDARSAFIIQALAGDDSEHGHHHHRPGAGSTEIPGEPGCVFSGFSSAPISPMSALSDLPVHSVPARSRYADGEYVSPAWFLPPVRSPPV